MYIYDEFDRTFIAERVAQFRDQVARRLDGELTEDEFKPLRLKNGVYLQLHAYMLRIAIPYGTLSSKQLRKLAHDRAQIRPRLRTFHDAAEHAVQLAAPAGRARDSGATSPRSRCIASRRRGNCIRNVTADHLAGVAPDEIEDPRLWAEIVRQWSTSASGIRLSAAQVQDRRSRARRTTAPPCKIHDIGLRIDEERRRRDQASRSSVGGGLGPHAVHRQDHPRFPAEAGPAALPGSDPARLQCSMAAATTSARRGSRS